MRELKFRAWDTTCKDGPKLEYCGPERIGEYHLLMEHIVEQFTGLKDRNGIDIYDGDIIATPERDVIFEVYHGWWDGDAGYGWALRSKKRNKTYGFDIGVTKMEVIGNIHKKIENFEERV